MLPTSSIASWAMIASALSSATVMRKQTSSGIISPMAVCPTPSFQRERRHATKMNGSKDRSDGLWPPPDVLEVENSGEIRGLLCCTSSCLSLRKLKGKFGKFRIWKLEWHKESRKWELCLIWPRLDSASLSRPLSCIFSLGASILCTSL